jgi:CheY-specific phosphatase CheX
VGESVLIGIAGHIQGSSGHHIDSEIASTGRSIMFIYNKSDDG